MKLVLAVFVALAVGAAVPTMAGTLKCPPDSVKVGNVCIDLYEASVWQIDPVANAVLVRGVGNSCGSAFGGLGVPATRTLL